MLKSKLSLTAFPCVPYAEIDKYLTFSAGVKKELLDPVFLGRLAALARDLKQKLNISSGKRDPQEQINIFLSRGGKYDAKLGYYWPASVPDSKKTVAKPGKSWHEFALAIDSDSAWFKAINKTEATAKQTILRKYGLFKPMTVGNGMSVLEDWHCQPIETLNVPVEKRKALMPVAA